MVLGRRLGLIHIDGRPGDLFLLQRFGQGHFIDDLAASIIYNQQIRASLVEEPFAIEQMARAFAAGDVEGDDIELRKELIEIADHAHFAIQSGLRGEVGIESQDGHFHGDGARGDGAADAAEADDAQSFAGQLSALIFITLPLAGLYVGVGGGDFAGQGHHQGQGVLGG